MKVHEIIPIVKIIYKQRTICSNYGESIKIYRRARALPFEFARIK